MNTPPAPVRPRRRIGWWLAGFVAALALAVLLAIGGLASWVWRSDAGTAWLLSQVSGLRIDGQRGTLRGGPFEAGRVEFVAGGRRVVIDGLAWRDLRWTWRPPGGAWLGLQVIEPTARRVELGPAASGGAAVSEPTSLRLPVQVQVQRLAIAALQWDPAQPPLTDLQADLQLGADAGRVHRLERLRFDWDRLHAELQGRIDADAPLALQADGRVRSRADTTPAWSASATVRGPLARLALDAVLLGGGSGDAARVTAQATLTPFAPWPLASLAASTQALDLSALASGWPATRLAGRADILSRGLDQPVQADIRLHNSLPGRWDAGRLPLEQLGLVLRGQPRAPDTVDVSRLALTLADDAGRVEGSGRWQGHTLALDLRLEGLRPQRVDRRLPAMTLGGPVTVAASGLPSPTGAAAAPAQRAELQLALEGRHDAAPRGAPAVALRTQARIDRDAQRLVIELSELSARSGAARAEGTLRLSRAAAGDWTAAGRGALVGFDPQPWFPGFGGPAWRRGPHRLSGAWALELGGPAPTDRPWLDQWLRWRGQATAELRDSRLAGVPLQGRATLRAGAAAAVDAELTAAGNRLRLDGRLGARAADDRWSLDLQAPALQALAPLADLHPALAGVLPRAGRLSGQASAQGRWPALASQGRLQAAALQVGTLHVARADLRWQGSAAADAPLTLDLEADTVARADQRLESLRARLEGSLRAHRFSVDATSPLRAPAWTERLGGAPATPGTPATPGSALTLRGEGAWLPGRGPGLAFGRWSGRLLDARVADRGRASTPWLAGSELAATLTFDGAGALREAAAAPGRVTLLGAALRWREARWQAADTGAPAARLSLDAELEPLAVAPWLARLQPEFRWGGDLTVGGRFVVRQGVDGFGAELVLERAGGDLHLTDDTGTQRLGLTDLRLALDARNGTWHFTQAAAGANLGVLAGAQSLRVPRDAAWPPPDTPVEGVLEWRVANLGVWAPFAPPGWRLGGSLRTSAALGGRFGAPEYTGRMVGNALELRNLLEGVHLRDGELDVSLRGADARIERFEFKGGDGVLRLDGGASFGAEPRAQLRLVAERFQLLGRFDRRIVASGSAELALQRDALKLDGRFTVDEGLVDFSRADAPSLDDDVVVRRRAGPDPTVPAAAREAPAPAGPLRNAQVALQIDLGERLALRGRGLDTRLRGRLAITTPGGRLAVNGSVRTDAGTYAAYGQKLDIERGVLRFAGAADNPRLDIVAVRPNLDVRVGVTVGGTAQNPRVRLFSEPEMGDTDKLSWLVLGRGPDGLGRTDTALLQRAALALLAGEGEAPSDALLRNLGLDEFSLRQTETGDVRDTVITLGKQLSRRWYVGYERGVNSTTGTWQLIYRIAQRFTLRAQSGGENALDLIWTWRWDEPQRRRPTMRAQPPP